MTAEQDCFAKSDKERKKNSVYSVYKKDRDDSRKKTIITIFSCGNWIQSDFDSEIH